MEMKKIKGKRTGGKKSRIKKQKQNKNILGNLQRGNPEREG